jgi:hypothetical protein
MTVSVRSYLAAGLAAATMSAVAVIPVTLPRIDAVTLPSIELSAAVLPLVQPVTAAAGAVLGTATPAAAATAAADPVAAATGSTGDMIINAYNALEPWVQWGFEVAAWAVSYLPWPLGWLGQQINIAYDTGEPIVQALVYSFAFLIDGQVDLIGPILTNGVNTAVTNLVQGEIAWVLGFFPPLPPGPVLPVFPTAAAAGRAAAVTAPAAARIRSAEGVSDNATSAGTASETTPAPIEDISEYLDPVLPVAVTASRASRSASRSGVRVQHAVTDPAPQSSVAAPDVAPRPADADIAEPGGTPVSSDLGMASHATARHTAARATRSVDRNG